MIDYLSIKDQAMKLDEEGDRLFDLNQVEEAKAKWEKSRKLYEKSALLEKESKRAIGAKILQD